MATNEQLIEVFEDTMKWIQEDRELANAVQTSIQGTHLCMEGQTPKLPKPEQEEPMQVTVTWSRSFEAAARLLTEHPDWRTAVHNFASATNPGGGVAHGSRAQEESLCRLSTLYPVLSDKSLWNPYYKFHRSRNDVRYTDACIWSPGIRIVKSDMDLPERLPKSEWHTVDVLTCAAPNLRPRPYNHMNPGRGVAISLTDEELLQLHKNRARHMLSVAACYGDQMLVLGAFGCGAFRNNPRVVAQAYREVLPEFSYRFRLIEFAVYCTPRDTRNYDAFHQILGNVKF